MSARVLPQVSVALCTPSEVSNSWVPVLSSAHFIAAISRTHYCRSSPRWCAGSHVAPSYRNSTCIRNLCLSYYLIRRQILQGKYLTVCLARSVWMEIFCYEILYRFVYLSFSLQLPKRVNTFELKRTTLKKVETVFKLDLCSWCRR